MLFNTLQFILFFIIITISYWYLPHKLRWFLLLIASCYFYMTFLPIYIFILGFTIVTDYIAGICLESITQKLTKKLFLILSLVANIGILAIFKYYNFFNDNINFLLNYFNFHSPLPIFQILLPIGLSFHTFQAMSYTIEVYRGNQRAERHFGIYALYVMFYPQLVAGPIERPQNMLWQFHQKKEYDFENMKSGLMQMVFGLFKKVVIADRLSMLVDDVYTNPEIKTGATVVMACIFYSFQIYCDFSGYSDIGIGAARTMGFNLMVNFKSPYLAKSISEFWTRWHISLSTWFRDYLYIPLGGNRVKPIFRYRNIMMVFLISGLWHGASWTFIIWGLIHGLFLVFGLIKDMVLKNFGINVPQSFFVRLLNTVITFILVTFAFIFFRAGHLSLVRIIMIKISGFSFRDSLNSIMDKNEVLFSILLIILLIFKERYFDKIATENNLKFYLLFCFVVICCYLFGVFNTTAFIYFQF